MEIRRKSSTFPQNFLLREETLHWRKQTADVDILLQHEPNLSFLARSFVNNEGESLLVTLYTLYDWPSYCCAGFQPFQNESCLTWTKQTKAFENMMQAGFGDLKGTILFLQFSRIFSEKFWLRFLFFNFWLSWCESIVNCSTCSDGFFTERERREGSGAGK